MNAVYPFVPFLLIALLAAGCQRPLIVDDDQTGTEANWEKVDFASERLIEGLYATPFEWYAISENQFFRFNGDNEPLELRPLQVRSGTLGIPVLSDNTFVRLTSNEDAQQVLEFHLTKNPAQIHEILVDSLKSPSDEFIEVEFFARSLGAFSDDGTLFLLPATVLPDRHYALLLFEIRHNQAHNEFTSIEPFHRIDLVELSAEFNNLVNIRYVDGNFYVVSKTGVWRVAPDGGLQKVFNQQMLDFFFHQGDLYATGINPFDLHKSTDNGLTWERLNLESELIWVETEGGLVFSQVAQSRSFNVGSEDLLKARPMVLPANVSPEDAIFYSVAFFAGRHYFSMDRTVYFTEEIVLQ